MLSVEVRRTMHLRCLGSEEDNPDQNWKDVSFLQMIIS